MMGEVEERSSKRRRTDKHDHNQHHQNSIESLEQLQNVLYFRQSLTPEVKSGINQFKDFLTSIVRAEDVPTKTRNLQILRQYCQTQGTSSRTEFAFSDVISTWSLAAQSNNDPICSAIPAALAQFYRTISGILEFRDFGLELGDALLKHANLRLFDRGLSASKTKDHLISPCLRLLTEIVSFDAGVLANRVFDHRDVLFRRLDFLLDAPIPDPDDDRRKPSVRRMALRLLIANLRYLDASAKAELLAHGRILRNCVQGLSNDGDDIVVDVLKAIESGVVQDSQIPRPAKSRLLGSETLTALARLYNYEADPNHPNSAEAVRDVVHRILLKICTTRKGILLPQTGWYPLAFDSKVQASSDEGYIDLGLESPLYTDEYSTNIPVKNGTLSAFAQSIKPVSDILQSALLLQILKSAPELVADYFNKNPKFTTSTDDIADWRSHFAFLFSVTQLPVPPKFGWHDGQPTSPPPMTIVVESILPRPLDRTILSKYLASKSDILILSAARLLTVALEKLQTVLQAFAARTNSSEWQQATTRLTGALVRRVPKIQDIVNALQQTEEETDSVKSTLLECLAVYHRVLPETVMNSKLDITSILVNTLARLDSLELSEAQTKALGEQLPHLLTIAQLSSTVKWWNKSDADKLTLFSQLLRFAVRQSGGKIATEVFASLKSVISTVDVLESRDAAFTALSSSLSSTKKFEVDHETWLILDNAIHRAVQKPVKYLDVIDGMQQIVSDTKPLSLLAPAVAEQWQYALKKYIDQHDILKNVAEWIVRFFGALESTGENFRVMQQLQEEMLHSAEGKTVSILQKAIEKGRKKPLAVTNSTEDDALPLNESEELTHTRKVRLDEILGVPTANPDQTENFSRLDQNTNIDVVVHSGTVAKLIRCVASPREEVRRQVFQLLYNLSHTVEQSTYDEKTQLGLLLGELLQTIRQQGLDAPLPSAVAELSIRLLDIVVDPAHKMYAKANKFLLRSPVWDIKRLIGYWTREILYHEPESDHVNAWIEEVEWFLQWLVDGLKSKEDMELYRRSGVFEKVLTLYVKPGLAQSAKRLILTMVWRGACMGGADTLVTRVGMQSWLELIESHDRERNGIVHQLSCDLADECDAKRIGLWRVSLPVLRSE